jgi:hypothetical protein
VAAEEARGAFPSGGIAAHIDGVFRITISAEAYAAIAGTLPWGTVGVEPGRAPDGSVHIWLDHATVARLRAARGPGESYSDVILRIVAGDH